MFLVLQPVINPITRAPLLSVGQKISGSELMRLSAQWGFDAPKHLHQNGVIRYVSNNPVTP